LAQIKKERNKAEDRKRNVGEVSFDKEKDRLRKEG
jgi:hypothetical protein